MMPPHDDGSQCDVCNYEAVFLTAPWRLLLAPALEQSARLSRRQAEEDGCLRAGGLYGVPRQPGL